MGSKYARQRALPRSPAVAGQISEVPEFEQLEEAIGALGNCEMAATDFVLDHAS